jgi:hypothetical protein
MATVTLVGAAAREASRVRRVRRDWDPYTQALLRAAADVWRLESVER